MRKEVSSLMVWPGLGQATADLDGDHLLLSTPIWIAIWDWDAARGPAPADGGRGMTERANKGAECASENRVSSKLSQPISRDPTQGIESVLKIHAAALLCSRDAPSSPGLTPALRHVHVSHR